MFLPTILFPSLFASLLSRFPLFLNISSLIGFIFFLYVELYKGRVGCLGEEPVQFQFDVILMRVYENLIFYTEF